MAANASVDDRAGKIGVMICDDVDAIRLLLRIVIEETPNLYLAAEATNGDEAVAEAVRTQPDVILLDISMPVRSGLDALPDIKLAAPKAVVIVFSGLADSVVESEPLKVGAAQLLQKGVDPQTIVAAIESTLASG